MRFIPFHLLSGVGIYAFLLSPARVTNCTRSHILLFLSSLPHDSDYWLIHRTIQTFFIGSIRLAIFFSLSISYMSESPLKTTPVLCRHSSLSPLPGVTPFKSYCPELPNLWLSLEVRDSRRSQIHRRWMHLHTEPSTFPTYEFVGYSVDGKPACPFFKELLQRLCPLRDCSPLFAE